MGVGFPLDTGDLAIGPLSPLWIPWFQSVFDSGEFGQLVVSAPPSLCGCPLARIYTTYNLNDVIDSGRALQYLERKRLVSSNGT